MLFLYRALLTCVFFSWAKLYIFLNLIMHFALVRFLNDKVNDVVPLTAFENVASILKKFTYKVFRKTRGAREF